MNSPETSATTDRAQAKWWGILFLLVTALTAAVIVALRLSPEITPLVDAFR
jgi:hypothetical protein